MKAKKFRVVLAGCGTISANHLKALSENPMTEVVALCDVKPERAEARAKEYCPEAKIYTDYKKMIDEEKPDAFHVTTPHYLHAEMAIYALDRNINVFLEKPMAISLDEIAALLDAEKRSKAKITVCFQNRYNPATLKARDLAESDGGVLSAYGSVFWERNSAYYTESGWRGFFKTEGGGVLINQSIHTIDLLYFFLGNPKKLCGTTANHHLKGVIEVEDTAEALIEFESGKQASFFATTAFHGYDSTTIFLKTKNHKIEIRGTKLFLDDEPVEIEDNTATVGKACYGNGHKYMVDAFYDAVENGTPVPVSLESAQYALRILLAIYRSKDEAVEV